MIFVIEQPDDDDCESTFIRRLGDFGVNEESFFLIPDGNGNYFVTGRDGNNSVILQVDPSGNILAQRSYNFTGGSDFVATLMVDSDGFLVGTARDQVNSNTTNILFKLNWTTGNLLWAKRLDDPAYNRFDGLFQHPQTGNYFHYGATTNAIDDYIIEMDENTGNISWQFVSDYGGNADVYTSHFLTNNAVYYAGEGRLGANLDDIRPTLTKFDLNGNLQWARIHLRSPNQSSRLYNMDLLVENDTIVNCGRGSLTNDNISLSQLLFYKTNINGTLIWAKSYTITGGTGVAGFQVHAIPGGYIVQGTYDEGGSTARLFLARLNKNGNVIWAKKINTATAAAGITKPLTLIDGGFVFFAAQTNQYDSGQNNDILFGKISLDGQVVGAGCELIEDINLVENAISNPYDGSLLPDVFTANYAFANSSFSPLPAELEVNDIPGCECPEPPSDCNETFVTAYGSPANEEGRNIVAVPGGFVFVTSKPDSLLFMGLDEEGKLIWQRSKHIIDGDNRVLKLSLDSEGNIFGCGTKSTGAPAAWESFAFRYDYQNNTMLWSNRYNYDSGNTFFFIGMVEKPNAGNFVLIGGSEGNTAPMGHGCDAAWVEVDRNTGNITFVRSFNIGSCETFYSPVIASDGTGVYVTGRYNTAGGGQNKFRGPTTKLDWSGNELWSRLYLVPVSAGSDARLYGVNLIEENNSLYTFGTGDLNGISLTDVSYQFYKTDLNGDIEWAMDYDIVGATSEAATRALSTPDGFLMLGFFTQGNRDICLLKINKQGTLQWAKSYGGTGDELGWDMEYQNGKIFLVGKTSSFGNGGDDALLLKLDLDGNIQHTDCDFSTDLIVTTTPIPNPYDGSHPLTAWTPATSLVSLPGNPQASTLTEVQLCYNPCPDTCANGLPLHTMPDAVLHSISGQCNGDSILVALEVCNIDSVALPAGTPLSFYQNNPTATTASLLATVLLPNAVATGACIVFNVEIALPINQQIFAVVNDNGSTPTPFDLSTDFPNTNIDECDFTNNIASFEVNFIAALLSLGPDISICHFEVTELDAGPGFAAYQWSVPGNNGQTYTAWEPGTYSVTVTDACGGTQVDDITITVVPSSIVEIGMDTAQICEGGSATFSVSGFNSYQWFPPDLVDCSTCPTVVASSTVDTCLILLAAGSDGCFSADKVCLQITPSPSTFDTIQFCQGETVIVFGNPVDTPGDYFQVFSAQNGCDSTHTITLLEIGDTSEIQEQVAICQGDSFLFFGTNLNAAGTYDHYDNSAGCTVHTQLELSLLDTFYMVENINICQGETVDIFGTATNMAGSFQMLFAAQNAGCEKSQIFIFS